MAHGASAHSINAVLQSLKDLSDAGVYLLYGITIDPDTRKVTDTVTDVEYASTREWAVAYLNDDADEFGDKERLRTKGKYDDEY